MKQKRLLIILGAIGAVILLVFPFIKNLSASDNGSDQIITEIALCDEDASDLCIVTFGKDNPDRMVINFQLPNADYPTFYVHGSNKGVDNIYQCETATAVPTSVYCTGEPTPLGEAIEIKVYAADGDTLIAQGGIMVSAMVLTTPSNFVAMPDGKLVTPTPTSPSSLFSSQPTPGTAYPSP